MGLRLLLVTPILRTKTRRNVVIVVVSTWGQTFQTEPAGPQVIRFLHRSVYQKATTRERKILHKDFVGLLVVLFFCDGRVATFGPRVQDLSLTTGIWGEPSTSTWTIKNFTVVVVGLDSTVCRLQMCI